MNKTHTHNQKASAQPDNVCPNCQQWQNWTSRGYYDCFHDCAERGFAPKRPTPAYEIEPEAPQSMEHRVKLVKSDPAILNRIIERAERAEASADKLAEALRDCVTTPGALAERSHEYAMRRLHTITETAQDALSEWKARAQ